MGSYLRPTRLDDALDALAAGPRVWTVVAGATDIYPARVGRAVDDGILDVSGLALSRAITIADGVVRIPALATWTDVVRSPLPPAFDGLKAAARAVGGVQIQHRGTVVGNVCNASPAADGVPNLLVLDASVELVSAADGRRVVPIAAFVLGNRRTARRPDELVTAILVPEPAPRARSVFLKLGSRAYLVISVVSVAAVATTDAGRVTGLRIAVGACSEVPVRLPAVEGRLVGADATDPAALAAATTSDDLRPLTPIDDVRASGDYRREAALVLVRRAVADVLG